MPRKESNAMKRISTTSTVLASTNMGAVGKAWDEVSASFDRFCLAEAAQRGAVQRNVAQRKADRDKRINDALDVLAPPPDERERCRAHIEEVLDLMASADRASEHAVTKKALSDYRDVLVRFRAGSKRS